eukprot:TRINITY_DN13064_c0_g1_i2.p1 TRINITY_DN13064_c0_g1~~TRINITY_DN13064_c0_g1_i2.p1  ORF type:complete len:394 (-),score=81.64 TRINITY_DN13064_c0_g1_i2:359-1540(-)
MALLSPFACRSGLPSDLKIRCSASTETFSGAIWDYLYKYEGAQILDNFMTDAENWSLQAIVFEDGVGLKLTVSVLPIQEERDGEQQRSDDEMECSSMAFVRVLSGSDIVRFRRFVERMVASLRETLKNHFAGAFELSIAGFVPAARRMTLVDDWLDSEDDDDDEEEIVPSQDDMADVLPDIVNAALLNVKVPGAVREQRLRELAHVALEQPMCRGHLADLLVQPLHDLAVNKIFKQRPLSETYPLAVTLKYAAMGPQVAAGKLFGLVEGVLRQCDLPPLILRVLHEAAPERAGQVGQGVSLWHTDDMKFDAKYQGRPSQGSDLASTRYSAGNSFRQVFSERDTSVSSYQPFDETRNTFDTMADASDFSPPPFAFGGQDRLPRDTLQDEAFDGE